MTKKPTQHTPCQAWDIVDFEGDGKVLDTVFYDPDMGAEEVQAAERKHDYPNGFTVRRNNK